MITGSNKERLEQEIANLIDLVRGGREFFFEKSGLSLSSSGDWFNHWKSKELFQEHLELRQLELNIQLFYIKLASYYELIDHENLDVSTRRHAFAHDRTRHIFGKDVNYNFFLHKVAQNFKKVQVVFYEERPKDGENGLVESRDLELDRDINDFIFTWTKSSEEKQINTSSVEASGPAPKTT